MNPVRRLSSRLMAATVERLRPIGPSRAESQRRRRAEDRDDRPVQPRKADCTGCVAARAADSEKRWPVGDCGPECLRRSARRAS